MDTSRAILGQHVPMSSPSFKGQGNHCLTFDYKVWVSPLGLKNMAAPRLEVNIRTSRHVYSGWKLWTSNGTGDGHTHITLWAQAGSTHWISFVGVVGHSDTTLISVANIRQNEGGCASASRVQETCWLERENYTFLSTCKYNVLIAELGSKHNRKINE